MRACRSTWGSTARKRCWTSAAGTGGEEVGIEDDLLGLRTVPGPPPRAVRLGNRTALATAAGRVKPIRSDGPGTAAQGSGEDVAGPRDISARPKEPGASWPGTE